MMIPTEKRVHHAAEIFGRYFSYPVEPTIYNGSVPTTKAVTGHSTTKASTWLRTSRFGAMRERLRGVAVRRCLRDHLLSVYLQRLEFPKGIGVQVCRAVPPTAGVCLRPSRSGGHPSGH